MGGVKQLNSCRIFNAPTPCQQEGQIALRELCFEKLRPCKYSFMHDASREQREDVAIPGLLFWKRDVRAEKKMTTFLLFLLFLRFSCTPCSLSTSLYHFLILECHSRIMLLHVPELSVSWLCAGLSCCNKDRA